MKKNRVEEVLTIIEQVLSEAPPEFVQGLTGYSGRRIVHLLGRLANRGGGNRGCYLEIGVFQGMTLSSVGYAAPEKRIYGIDNFKTFDPNGDNMRTARAHLDRLGLKCATIINEDYEDALASLSENIGDEKVDCYFIDGPHDYRSQLMCLLAARAFLHEDAVIIIDDCNYEHVRQATHDFLTAFPAYRLVFEAYTECHPNNMTVEERKKAIIGWWNGIHVLVRDDDNVLPEILPPTRRDRRKYLNEHTLHSSRYFNAGIAGASIAEGIDRLRKMAPWSAKEYFKVAAVELWNILTQKENERAEFSNLNTYSRRLTTCRLSELK